MSKSGSEEEKIQDEIIETPTVEIAENQGVESRTQYLVEELTKLLASKMSEVDLSASQSGTQAVDLFAVVDALSLAPEADISTEIRNQHLLQIFVPVAAEIGDIANKLAEHISTDAALAEQVSELINPYMIELTKDYLAKQAAEEAHEEVAAEEGHEEAHEEVAAEEAHEEAHEEVAAEEAHEEAHEDVAAEEGHEEAHEDVAAEEGHEEIHEDVAEEDAEVELAGVDVVPQDL